MATNDVPNPLYGRVCDHLEQAQAIISHDPAAGKLRQFISDAIDEATWLAYLTPRRPVTLRLVVSHTDQFGGRDIWSMQKPEL